MGCMVSLLGRKKTKLMVLICRCCVDVKCGRVWGVFVVAAINNFGPAL